MGECLQRDIEIMMRWLVLMALNVLRHVNQSLKNAYHDEEYLRFFQRDLFESPIGPGPKTRQLIVLPLPFLILLFDVVFHPGGIGTTHSDF